MIRRFLQATFSSLRIRNYRLFFIGQGVSQSGTWMQTVALGWLALQMTGSGSQLGLVVAAQFVPILIGGVWAGSVVDVVSKKKLLVVTQVFYAIASVIISALIYIGSVEVWMLYVFALSLGIIRMFDNPARQSFVSEMVDAEHVKNAVSLNSTMNNLGRAVGPSIGGIVIAFTSIAFCFLFNAGTYLVMIYLLSHMRNEELHVSNTRTRKTGVWAGLRYVRSVPIVRDVLVIAALVGTFAYEFQVSLPILTKQVFHGDAAMYASLMTAFGIGSVIGGLFSAGRHEIAARSYIGSLLAFGVCMFVTALSPTIGFALAGMVLVGFFSINVISIGNTMVQLKSAPEMRGRVMALWGVAMLGSTPIGGPIIGFIGENIGARWGIAAGGFAALLAAIWGARTLLIRDRMETVPDTVIAIEQEETAIAAAKHS